MKFEIDKEQLDKIAVWIMDQDAIVLAEQKNSTDPFTRQMALDGIPYYGACGGELSYCFTPTSMGTILVVKHSRTKAEIDVTDYDSW